jgi:hypothetical protein
MRTFLICRVTVTCASGSHTVRHISVSAAGWDSLWQTSDIEKYILKRLLVLCSLLHNVIVPVVSTCEFSVFMNNGHCNDYGNL